MSVSKNLSEYTTADKSENNLVLNDCSESSIADNKVIEQNLEDEGHKIINQLNNIEYKNLEYLEQVDYCEKLEKASVLLCWDNTRKKKELTDRTTASS